VKAEPLAGFEEWSEVIRHPLIWLGLPDPVESMKDARMLDPERGELSSRIKALLEVFGAGAPGRDFSAADIHQKSLEPGGSGPYGQPTPLYPALLMAFAANTNSRAPMNAKTIGNLLVADLNRVVDGYRLVIAKESSHGHRYKLMGPDYYPKDAMERNGFNAPTTQNAAATENKSEVTLPEYEPPTEYEPPPVKPAPRYPGAEPREARPGLREKKPSRRGTARRRKA
jgi:hypothetical protein